MHYLSNKPHKVTKNRRTVVKEMLISHCRLSIEPSLLDDSMNGRVAISY